MNSTSSRKWTNHLKSRRFPSKMENKATILILITFNTILEVLASEIRQQKEIKTTEIKRKEIKLSLFANNMTFYIGNLKKSREKLL